MTKETKQDVFDRLLKEHCKTILDLNPASSETDVKQIVENVFRDNYAAASPCKLPVIPKAVGEYIIDAKAGHNGIGFVLMIGGHAMTSNRIAFEEWLTRVNSYSDRIDRENTFARAWVLGVWCVDETEEIVKLEAEK